MIHLNLGRAQGSEVLKDRALSGSQVKADAPDSEPLDFAQIGIGAGVGGLVGAGVGAAVQAVRAHNMVQDVPIQHVTETWQVPVTTTQEIGKIPHEQYTPASHWWNDTTSCSTNSWSRPTVVIDNNPTVPVRAEIPTLDPSGNPTMRPVTRDFSGHGTPNVDWKEHDINMPKMKGYTTVSRDDTHYETHYPNDKETCSVSVLDGIRTTFNPNIQNTRVGDYKAPEVSFNSGVHTGTMILQGMGIGFVGGAILGGAAMVAKQELQKRHH